MTTALQTQPSGGMPAGLRRPSLDELSAMMDPPKVIAAGTILRAPDGSILFLKRSSDEQNYADHWALPGGGLDEDEAPDEAARRECLEETGYEIVGDLDPVDEVVTGSGTGKFATFENRVAQRFKPTFRDGEHTDFVWALPEEAPRPMHPAVAKLLADKYGSSGASDSALRIDPLRLAFDRDSVRTKIEDNGKLWRLEVAAANLSKATVNPYLGREIPNGAALGLEADKVYQLLRDPEELRKAAPTLNMVPLLRKHRPIAADDHQPYDVVGSTGSSAEFADPYLRNGLSIWTREAVDDLESERKKELSCGYGYRAEMTPGIFDGMRYDGVMRDIKFNHVAMVEDGRAGPDVVIGDSNEEITMAENRDVAKLMDRISRRQVSVNALMSYLAPRMALDAKTPIMARIFDGVAGKDFTAKKAVIAQRIREIATPKLKTGMAADASLKDVEAVLDMLDAHEVDPAVDESVSEPQHNAMEAAAHGSSTLGIPEKVGKEFVAKDAPPEEFREFMKGKGASDEEIQRAFDMAHSIAGGSDEEKDDDKKAKDEDETDEEKKKKKDAEAKAAADKAAKDAEMKDMVTKPAMDAAIKLAADNARDSVLKTQREVRQAEAEVRPWVGELPATIAFDSAEQVKRHALKMLAVEGHDKMHADALSAVLAVQPKPGARDTRREESKLGMDAATTKSFHDRFPGSDRIGIA